MKLYGSLSRLVNLVFRKDSNDITLRPNQGTTYTASRDMQLPPGDTAHVIVSATSTQTLTNKSIDADTNTITNIDNNEIKAAAGIVYSKLNLSNSIVNADINAAAAIAYSKLNLSASIVNADIAAGAAIAYSKLNLSASIVNADIAAGANIDASKLGTGAVSNTEFNYLDGVTSSIQTQLDGMLKLGGRSGGQNASGGTGASENLLLQSTANATKGFIKVRDGSSVSVSASADADAYISTPGQLMAIATDNSKGVGLVIAYAGDQSGADGAEAQFYSFQGDYTALAPLTSGNAILAIKGIVTEDNGTTYAFPASLRAYATENHGIGSAGTNWQFNTANNGSDTPAVRAEIGNGALSLQNGTNLSFSTNGQVTSLDGSASASASVAYQLPPAGPASSGYVLASTTGGVMSWVSNASSSSFKETFTSASPKTVTHNLGTTDVMVQIYDVDSGETIEVDSAVRTSGNVVTLTYSETPAGSGWRVMVLAV